MTTCPACGAEVHANQRFCGECGTRLETNARRPGGDDRNAVQHRPGGGSPDPWNVGSVDDDGDDFFSQFRPKSAVDADAGSEPPRSRRRFNPRWEDTGQVPEVQARREAAARVEAERAARERVAAEQAAAERDARETARRAATARAAERAERALRDREAAIAAASVPSAPVTPPAPAVPPAPATPPVPVIPPAAATPSAAFDSRPATPPAAFDSRPATPAAARDEVAPPAASVRNPSQELPPLPPAFGHRGASTADVPPVVAAPPAPASAWHDDEGAPTAQMSVAEVHDQLAAPTPEAEDDERAVEMPGWFSDLVDDEDDDATTPAAPAAFAPPAPPVAGPGSQPVSPAAPRPGSEAGEGSTFTQLINGLPEDPADAPIRSRDFEQTGIVPVPQPADPSGDAHHERATALFGQPSDTPPVAGPPVPPAPEPRWPDESQYGAAAAPGADARGAATPAAGAARYPDAAATQPRTESPFDDIFGEMPPLPAPVPAPAPVQRPAQNSRPPEDDFDRLLAGIDVEDEPLPPATGTMVGIGGGAGAASAAAAAARRAEARNAASGRGQEQSAGQDASGQRHPHAANAAWAGGSGSGGASGGAHDSGTGSNGGDGPATRRRGLITIIVAAAAAVVLIVGALVLTGVFGGKSDDIAATQSATTEPAVETSVAPAPETTPAPTNFTRTSFASTSGNIICQIDPTTGVACQMLNRDFSLPSGECRGPNYSGMAVGLTTEGISWPCLNADLRADRTVAYNENVTVGEFTCSINLDTGVTCKNAKGDSFTMEHSRGVQTTGPVIADPHLTVPVN